MNYAVVYIIGIAFALFFGLKRLRGEGDLIKSLMLSASILFLTALFGMIHSLIFEGLFITLMLFVQFAAWLTFLFAPLYLFGLAWLERKRLMQISWVAVAVGLIISIIGIYSFLIEPYNLEVSEYTISSSKISEPITIGLLADIQTDNVGDYERRVIEELMVREPDLILMAGDYIQDGFGRDFIGNFELLNDLFIETGFSAPLGIYAVGGDSEHSDLWTELLDGSGINLWHLGGSDTSGEVAVTGLSLLDSSNGSLRIDSKNQFHIVFGHRPDFALGQIEADLLLAGHSHGGQVVFPLIGPLVTATGVSKAWVDGHLVELEKSKHLVISRGIGMERREAPRLRFNCRPQLVIIKVLPQG